MQQGDVDLSKLDDTIDDATLKKGKGKRAREEGFGGTALFGWESQEKVEAAEGGGMEVDGAEAAVEKAQEDDEEDEIVLSVASPKRPRRGAQNGGAATAEASTSSKQGGSASTNSKGNRSKKASLVMEDDSQEEGPSGLACAACTFDNDLGAETCSMCEGALGVPADALS